MIQCTLCYTFFYTAIVHCVVKRLQKDETLTVNDGRRDHLPSGGAWEVDLGEEIVRWLLVCL